MAFPPQQPTPYNGARVTRVHMRGKCAACGYLGSTQLIEEHHGPNGVKKTRLPIPPKRCHGCGLRMPYINYVPRKA